MNANDIGARMSLLRKEQGITMRELAELAGLSEGQISRLENGRQGFRSETLVRIAAALGVRPYRLLLPAGTSGSHLPEGEFGGEFSNGLREALRHPEFVSVLRNVERTYRTRPRPSTGSGRGRRELVERPPRKFRAVRTVVEALLGAGGSERQGKGS